jgi:predicted amidophosphoribosyltransferase
VLAAMMEPLVPSDTVALAPIPRIHLRRIKYRSDPARLLASALSRRSGVKVLSLLGPRVWGGSNAGRDRSSRSVSFRRLGRPPKGVLLVDDVITTGMTLQTAAVTLGSERVRAAVTATASI